MTDTELIQKRQHNQHLSGTLFKQPAEVVRWLGAVQAQDYAGAKWGLGVRLPGVTDHDVERAFTDGAILRTHIMRPTWHFVAPADIRWLLALTAPRVHALNALYYRKCELDQPTLQRSRKVLARSLRDGRQLTRDELRSEFAQAGIPTDSELRMAYLMMNAELEGVACSGPRRGKQFTYALLEERVPQGRQLERDEALSELILRYFASRGPATLQDFAWWSGLTAADAKRGVEAAKSQLECATHRGKTYWFARAVADTNSDFQPAHLLPNYDEYGIAYRDRSAFFDAEVAKQLIFNNLIFINGRLAGTWKRTLRKDAVIVESNTFKQLTKVESRALAAAARRYGKFLQLPVEMAK
jgi:winged helix DNA-binding protein